MAKRRRVKRYRYKGLSDAARNFVALSTTKRSEYLDNLVESILEYRNDLICFRFPWDIEEIYDELESLSLDIEMPDSHDQICIAASDVYLARERLEKLGYAMLIA